MVNYIKISLNIFFTLLVIGLCSCQPNIVVAPDVIRLKIGKEPATLNPITASDSYTSQIEQYTHEYMIDRDLDTLEFKPKLATRWEISDDKKIFTFYLRRDVRWHDGHPLTADDVVYSYNLLMSDKIDAPHAKVYYQDIDRVEKVDDYTVKFHYKKIYFLGFSVCGTITIVPKHIVEKYDDFEASPFSRAPIATGPYKFKEWVSGKKIVLTRNEDYWGKKPEIREIQFLIIADEKVSFQVLKKGEIDMAQLTPIQWARQTNSKKFNENFYRFQFPSPGFSWIGWNNVHFAFKDKNVRRAMTLAIPREKISQKMSFGIDTIVNGTFFPDSKQYNKNIEPWPYDPKRAAALLTEAGWRDSDNDGVLDKDGKAFRFKFLLPSGGSDRIVTILQQELKNLGIAMDIEKIEWAAYLEKFRKREFDASLLGWGAPLEMDPYQIWDISQADTDGSSNVITFRNQAASDLIRAARVEFDEEKRNAIYHKFSEILHEEQPYTFLFNRPEMTVVSKRFGNVKRHKLGLDLLEWTVGAGSPRP